MSAIDTQYFFQWWGMFFILGIFFLPLTLRLFEKFPDKGYIFTKFIGLVIISYIVFIIGLLHLLPFTLFSLSLVCGILGIVSFLSFIRFPHLTRNLLPSIKILAIEEVLFFCSLYFWSFIRSHQSDIHGLEKFMDYGFINTILRSNYFPPTDMWFPPFPINYYYFGHFFTAIATRLSFVPSNISYNLMLATIFAFTFCGAFSIGYNLLNAFLRDKKNSFVSKITLPFAGGIITALLISLGGNLHTVYTLFKPYENENPLPFTQLPFSPLSFPNLYWYPNATRFIYNTIHEFPLYSFVVSDLHGHVLSIPIVLTIIAILLHETLTVHSLPLKKTLLLGFLLGIAYMTNAWDAMIYFLLTAIIVFTIPLSGKNIFHFYKIPSHLLNALYSLIVLFAGFLVFSLPFSYNFKPFVSGIGILCAPSFLLNIKSFGPFLFEADHCQHSLWWQLLILHGFFYFWVAVFFFKLKPLKNYIKTDVFILALISLSTFLLILPEIIYMKDIYPAHYRANTMFKLGYQAFIMLSISSGYIITRIIMSLKPKMTDILIILIGCIAIWIVSIYPYFAINSYYGDLKTQYGLDGTAYLKKQYPSDYQAINWLNSHIKNQSVILEAQGDSYTDYGRVSVNTGLPTVLGWTVHEWLWRGTYDIPAVRLPDIPTLYESTDIDLTKQLIKKYNISLIFIGDLERQKYPKLEEEKFKQLGKLIYQSVKTRIYQIN